MSWALPFFLPAVCVVSAHAQALTNDQTGRRDLRRRSCGSAARQCPEQEGGIRIGASRAEFQRGGRWSATNHPKRFHPEDIPVAVGRVVDNSGSMNTKRSDCHRGGSSVRALK